MHRLTGGEIAFERDSGRLGRVAVKATGIAKLKSPPTCWTSEEVSAVVLTSASFCPSPFLKQGLPTSLKDGRAPGIFTIATGAVSLKKQSIADTPFSSAVPIARRISSEKPSTLTPAGNSTTRRAPGTFVGKRLAFAYCLLSSAVRFPCALSTTV